jgi:nucleoside-diphosphate-sugar epimerase
MRVLIFGASGTLGSAISKELSAKGIVVTNVSNSSISSDIQTINGFEPLKNLQVKFDGCVWAQGLNTNDTLLDSDNFQEMLNVNLVYIVESLRYLIKQNLLT